MAPDINNPGGVKNDPDEIRDGVVSDSTRFQGGFIDQAVSSAGAALTTVGQGDISNASRVQALNLSDRTSSVQDITIGDGGSKLYVSEDTNANVIQFNLSTPFDISTATAAFTFSDPNLEDSPSGLTIGSTGTDLFVTGDQKEQIIPFSLSTPFDLSTASFSSGPSISSQTASPSGLTIGPDGDRVYLSGRGNANIYQYSLSTSFDINTLSFVRSFSVGAQDSSPRGVNLSPAGDRMYVAGDQNTSIYEYRLSTAFDISTASFVRALDVSPNITNVRDAVISAQGSRLYAANKAFSTVEEYAIGAVVGDTE